MDLLPCLMIQVRFFMEPLYLCGQGSKFMTRLLWSSWQVSELAEDVRTEHAALRDTSSTAMSDHGWILQLDLSRWVLKSLTLHSDPGLPFACTKVSVSERYTEVLGNKSRKSTKSETMSPCFTTWLFQMLKDRTFNQCWFRRLQQSLTQFQCLLAERSLCAGGHKFIMERCNSAFDLTPYSFPLRDPSNVQLPWKNG